MSSESPLVWPIPQEMKLREDALPLSQAVIVVPAGVRDVDMAPAELLADQLEPLATAAHFLHGLPYPAGEIDVAWKLLLQNHPHDSICGCSTDAVHREMVTRFDAVRQLADQLLREILVDLAPTFAPEPADDEPAVLVVGNALPVRRPAVIERTVVLPWPGVDPGTLCLTDAAGRPVTVHYDPSNPAQSTIAVQSRWNAYGRLGLGVTLFFGGLLGLLLSSGRRQQPSQ